MASADATAEFGASKGFPFRVLPGGDAAGGGDAAASGDGAIKADKAGVFDAYARRTVPLGKTAREALVQALVLSERGAAQRRDEMSSYGLLPDGTVPPLPKAPKVAPIKQAPPGKRRPSLASEPPARVEEPAARAAQKQAPVAVPEEETTAKPKIALRRPAQPSAPEIPFVPIPGAIEPNLAPLMPLHRAPADHSVLAPLSAPVAPVAMMNAPVAPIPNWAPPNPFPNAPAKESPAAIAAALAANREMWWGRAGVAALATAFLVLGAVELRYRHIWPFQADEPVAAVPAPAPVVASTVAAPLAKFWTVEVNEPSLTPVGSPAGERPAPSLELVKLVNQLKISGVMKTDPVRAIINGRLIEKGDLVEVTREIRLVGAEASSRRLIFEDRTTAQVTARY